ncbi:hypothetical protein PPERSA_06431 [Pseudocohnilembus persalinus]|uniref:Uncharacterized protein n=1 Tax=Pseudocohnilembus persalinus TaxID=266149 RepID=A0A0V0QRJ9_PSEPJ|nr:hypothetical protein PPERSA_06431 [Pseudocohnilembus persalinus]|eukprot:KRX04797.1 hypothetical protein PPERSA_06431 [Pseudocohnilembus persalinus]
MQSEEQTLNVTCKKVGHENSPFVYFKFSEEKDKIIQCIYCMLKDKQEFNMKNIIKDIQTKKPWEIQNFPPHQDQNMQKKLQEAIKNAQDESFDDFKQKITQQIKNYYDIKEQESVNLLKQQKKQVLLEFEQIFQIIKPLNTYSLDKLKESLNQFFQEKIDINKLYEVQLELKKQFQYQVNINDILQNNEFQKKTQQQLKSFQQQLDEQIESFQKQIKIEIKQSHKINLIFNKSDIDLAVKREINLSTDEDKNQIIKYGDKTIETFKQVYSNNLDKNKTYNIKLKIKINREIRQHLRFALLDFKNRNQDYQKENAIILFHPEGYCKAINGLSADFQGLKFSQFFEDNQTVFNIIINFSKKQFEIFDSEKKCYIKNEIDQAKVPGQLIFGVYICQTYKQRAKLSILDATCI